MRVHRRPMRGPWTRALASAGLVGLLLGTAACGGSDDGGGDAEAGAVSDVSEAGDPVDGGEITVGMEAETNSWLPSEGTFNQPGVNVAYAIYDPLMHRTEDGGVEPYLAESHGAERGPVRVDAEAPPGRAVPRRHPAGRPGAEVELRRLPEAADLDGSRRPSPT